MNKKALAVTLLGALAGTPVAIHGLENINATQDKQLVQQQKDATTIYLDKIDCKLNKFNEKLKKTTQDYEKENIQKKIIICQKDRLFIEKLDTILKNINFHWMSTTFSLSKISDLRKKFEGLVDSIENVNIEQLTKRVGYKDKKLLEKQEDLISFFMFYDSFFEMDLYFKNIYKEVKDYILPTADKLEYMIENSVCTFNMHWLNDKTYTYGIASLLSLSSLFTIIDLDIDKSDYKSLACIIHGFGLNIDDTNLINCLHYQGCLELDIKKVKNKIKDVSCFNFFQNINNFLSKIECKWKVETLEQDKIVDLKQRFIEHMEFEDNEWLKKACNAIYPGLMLYEAKDDEHVYSLNKLEKLIDFIIKHSDYFSITSKQWCEDTMNKIDKISKNLESIFKNSSYTYNEKKIYEGIQKLYLNVWMIFFHVRYYLKDEDNFIKRLALIYYYNYILLKEEKEPDNILQRFNEQGYIIEK